MEKQELERSIDETMALELPVVGTPPPLARLVCVNPAELKNRELKEIPLDRDRLFLGSDGENNAVLDVPGISRFHACFLPGTGCWGVIDLDSKNGVWVNKSRTSGVKWLAPGDIVSLARIHYKLTVPERVIEGAPPRLDLGGDDKTMMLDVSELAAARSAGATSAPAPKRGAATTASRQKPSQPRTSLLWPVLIALGLILVGYTAALLF